MIYLQLLMQLQDLISRFRNLHFPLQRDGSSTDGEDLVINDLEFLPPLGDDIAPDDGLEEGADLECDESAIVVR